MRRADHQPRHAAAIFELGLNVGQFLGQALERKILTIHVTPIDAARLQRRVGSFDFRDVGIAQVEPPTGIVLDLGARPVASTFDPG